MFLAPDETLTPNESVTLDPRSRLRPSARTAINSARSSLDCLGDGEAFLAELPFDLKLYGNWLCLLLLWLLVITRGIKGFGNSRGECTC